MLYTWSSLSRHVASASSKRFIYEGFLFGPQELYQKLTDYDIRYYMYELLKVRLLVLITIKQVRQDNMYNHSSQKCLDIL